MSLLGSETTYPFLGHLEAEVVASDNVISVAARFGHQSPPKACFQSVRMVELELRKRLNTIIQTEANLADWIRALWSFWMQQSKTNYGADAGADLSVAMYVRCSEQAAISAAGVTGVWGQIDQVWMPVVKSGHPMLGKTGVPTVFPGVFQLSRLSPFFVAAPYPDRVNTLDHAHIEKRIGESYGA